VLFLSSIAGRIATPGTAAYASSKWALEAFAEALAVEVAGFGIDVTLAEPGHHSRSRAVLRSRNQHFEMVGSVGHDRHWRRALVVSWRRRGLQQASG